MRYLCSLASTVAFVILVAGSALAQQAPLKFELFGEGGLSYLNGSSGLAFYNACSFSGGAPPPCLVLGPSTVTSSFTKTGRLMAGGRFRFSRNNAFEASYSFSPNHLTLQGTEGILFPSGVAVNLPLPSSSYNRVSLLSLNYVRYVWTRGRFQPFATVGVGAQRFSGPYNIAAVSSGLISASNGVQMAGNFGGGTDFALTRYLALRVEVRDYRTRQPAFLRGASDNIVPSAGIVVRFK